MKKTIVLLCVILFTTCKSTPAVLKIANYYVANRGSDSNEGITEQMPFKTMSRAIEMSSTANIVTITVIGKLAENTIIDNPAASEILITGKPDATDREKAVILNTPRSTDNVIHIKGKSNVKIEHLTVTGTVMSSIYVQGKDAKLTLGAGSVVSGNKGNSDGLAKFGGGLLVVEGNAILQDNALITNNNGSRGGGAAVVDGATMIMKNNALISKNKADAVGGGIFCNNGTVKILENASITENNAPHGGGVYLTNSAIETSDKVRVKTTGTYESRHVSGNTATQTRDGVKSNNIFTE